MNRIHCSWAALAAAVLLLAACSDEATPQADPDPDGRAVRDADYVLLLDDDSDPDQVLGEPGAYALTARGARHPAARRRGCAGRLLELRLLRAACRRASPTTRTRSGRCSTGPSTASSSTRATWTTDAPDAGTTVDDLAAALAAQKRTSVSEPGAGDPRWSRRALPRAARRRPTSRSRTARWATTATGRACPDDAQHTVDSPGTVDRAWILDVDGERVVLLTAAPPGVTDELVAEMTAMVESVRFVEPE